MLLPFLTSVVLGRDHDWIDLNLQYTLHVVKGALIVRLFPNFLKPLVASIACPSSEPGSQLRDSFAARFFTKVVQSNERGRRLLGPIIEERKRYLDEYGDQWADKPVGEPHFRDEIRAHLVS